MFVIAPLAAMINEAAAADAASGMSATANPSLSLSSLTSACSSRWCLQLRAQCRVLLRFPSVAACNSIGRPLYSVYAVCSRSEHLFLCVGVQGPPARAAAIVVALLCRRVALSYVPEVIPAYACVLYAF